MNELNQTNGTDQDQKFAEERERMVREQLKGRDVDDPRVLAAMLRVPRHKFVPEHLAGSAYSDNALPLTLGQTISQPYIVGYMTQALSLQGNERVLEIGTGSGYQAAVLAETCAEVFSVEIVPELGRQARSVLESLGYRNIRLKIGDGYRGWEEFAPYDRIIVTAAPDHIPEPLLEQLKTGGRMVIPVGSIEQELMLLEKSDRGIVNKTMIPVRFVPMTGAAQKKPE
jgi:protein-L-isoaspartate(D-aspartate) O-methyltransferase